VKNWRDTSPRGHPRYCLPGMFLMDEVWCMSMGFRRLPPDRSLLSWRQRASPWGSARLMGGRNGVGTRRAHSLGWRNARLRKHVGLVDTKSPFSRPLPGCDASSSSTHILAFFRPLTGSRALEAVFLRQACALPADVSLSAFDFGSQCSWFHAFYAGRECQSHNTTVLVSVQAITRLISPASNAVIIRAEETVAVTSPANVAFSFTHTVGVMRGHGAFAR